MQLHTLDHDYRCQVPGYEDTDLVLVLKVIPSKEYDAAIIEASTLTPEGVSDATNKLVMSKVSAVEGYDGITDGKELYENGHPDIWDFVKKAVFKARILSAHEIKN